MSDQDIVAEVTQNQNVVFALSAPQSVRLLSALVHDTSLPIESDRGPHGS